MQFFALILINIAMFAIFYLLISLKLERKATEFREKKLRRLMEEMIADFNETAERNITLLENRINTMKRLLQSPGGIRSLDVSVMDGEEESIGIAPAPEETHTARGADTVEKKKAGGNGNAQVGPTLSMAGEALVKGAGTLARKLRGLMTKPRESDGMEEPHAFPGDDISNPGERAVAERITGDTHHEPEFMEGRKSGSLIQKDFSALGSNAKKGTAADILAVEEEIMILFREAGDKYALVGDLYGKGYSIELISRSSGIPQGEIRLVLNLGI